MGINMRDFWRQRDPNRTRLHGDFITDSHINLITYATFITGYVISIVDAQRLTAPGFILFTIGNVIWLWLYYYGQIHENAALNPRYIAAMLAVSMGVMVVTLLGVALDWLLPILTVGVLSSQFTLRRAMTFTLTLYGSLLLVLLALERGFTRNFWENCASLGVAYLFVFIFSFAARQQRQQRERAERLVAELEQKTTDLEAAHAQLRAYASEVEELATTRERNRMAREIHDTLGHYLTILAVQLETATKLEERADPRLRAELAEARRVAAECLAEVRRSVAALRPADITAVSFTDALRRLVTEFEAVCPDVAVTADLEGPAQELAAEIRVALYRAAQEALTNIRKHAQASKVLVRLRVDAAQAELTVLDNGQGELASPDGHTPGFGLLGMRERIALLGGVATSQPAPEQGWRVEVIVPRNAAATTVLQQARAVVNALPEDTHE